MKLYHLAVASVLLLCAACASTTSKLDPWELANSKGYFLGEPVEGIHNYRLSGWNYVNNRALIISTSPNKRYLVTLRDSCQELSTAELIGTTATVSYMRAGFDAVLVKRDGAGHSHPGLDFHKCYIDNIYALTKLKASDS